MPVVSSLSAAPLRKTPALHKTRYGVHQELTDRLNQAIDLYYLGILAEARGSFKEAEDLYRKSLLIRGNEEDDRNTADLLLLLGRLLIKQHNNKAEGCFMITKAVELYAQMNLPDEQMARDIALQLGCME